MDSNLLYWKSQGQSFLSRVQTWVNLLDPTLLLSSDAEIQRAHSLLQGGEKSEKDAPALTLALSSVHADSGAVLPLVFRPPALLPISAPLVVASFLPHNNVKPALFWQFLLQSYSAGFNYANRNSSSEQALPQIFINRLGVRSAPVQTFFRSILPIPLSAALAFFNVFTVRSEESETGIQVFDSNGNPVGISKAAGEKAVRETALSRAALFGTTAAVPNLLVLLLQRTRLFQRNSLLVAPLRHMSVAFVLGLMIPVSFSLFPQLGTIKKEKLEEELQAAAVDGQLFYNRGL
ncbi:sideroflexin-4 isoform X2 [Xiphias gladius]|uniref:sideroflexin-4 isoform X2 n=1 Tax=Xiphias gladius TaxID=8245 RepID=UPI001A996874|nr:sideroflexin-4 isoform X2 [Xiphias gladius]